MFCEGRFWPQSTKGGACEIEGELYPPKCIFNSSLILGELLKKLVDRVHPQILHPPDPHFVTLGFLLEIINHQQNQEKGKHGKGKKKI